MERLIIPENRYLLLTIILIINCLRSKGIVEKFNGTLAVTISKLMFERKTKRWIDLLDEALFAYRVTVGATKKTPFEIFFMRKPNFVYSLPGEPQQNEENSFRIDENELHELHDALIEDVREQREKNAATMKKRWDTSNTQPVSVGDYVLVDPRKGKKKRKRGLGEPLFHVPGIVESVNASGNIKVKWKEGSNYFDESFVPNNKFRVVNKSIYESTVSSFVASDSSSEESQPKQSKQPKHHHQQQPQKPGKKEKLIMPSADAVWFPVPSLRVSIFWKKEARFFEVFFLLFHLINLM